MGTVATSHAYWLNKAFNNIDGIINNARIALEGVEYDTMVGTGLSGGLVIPVLAREFGTHFAIIRKEHSTHDGRLFQGQIGQRWIFVDDFVSTGETRIKVKDAVNDFCRSNSHESTYVGTYSYNPDIFTRG